MPSLTQSEEFIEKRNVPLLFTMCVGMSVLKKVFTVSLIELNSSI